MNPFNALNFIVSGWRMLNGSYESGGKRGPVEPLTLEQEAANIATNAAGVAAQKAQEAAK